MHPDSPQTLLDAAEEKFKLKNAPAEALNLATKAKQIDPNFPGIDNYLAAYRVHAAVAASKKKNSRSVDWYAILGLTGTSHNIETVKKQYKKLSLMVHPDKNGSAASEGAFKMVSQAWKVISAEPSAVDNNNDGNERNYMWRSSMWTRKERKPETHNDDHTPYCVKCGRCSKYPSVYCLYCIQKKSESQQSSSSFSSRGAGPSSATGSRDRGKHTEEKPIVNCLLCNSPCVSVSCVGYVSFRCTECDFGHSVPAKKGWGAPR